MQILRVVFGLLVSLHLTGSIGRTAFAADGPITEDRGDKSSTSLLSGLLGPEDFEYLGAFRFPAFTGMGDDPLNRGRAGTFLKVASPRTLYVGGNNDRVMAEIEIPELVKSGDAKELIECKLVSPWRDPTGGAKDRFAQQGKRHWLRVGGVHRDGDRLYYCFWEYYDVAGHRFPCFGWSDAKTLKPIAGPYWVSRTSNTGGYLTVLPDEAAALVGGRRFLCGMAMFNWGSRGPQAVAVKPEPDTHGNLDTLPLLGYGGKNEQKLKAQGEYTRWQGANRCNDVAFVHNGRDKHALLFVGLVGMFPVTDKWPNGWYGKPDKFPGPAKAYGDKGYHAPPYRPVAWVYDFKRLAAARASGAKPMQPHIWNLADLGWTWKATYNHERMVNAVCFDDATRRVYLMQGAADVRDQTLVYPVVHVLQVRAR